MSSESELGTDEVEMFIEELYLAGYRNNDDLNDVEPGYEYAVQQLCSEMAGTMIPALTKDAEMRAMNRAQERHEAEERHHGQFTELECPDCEEVVDARYLGTADTDKHDGHIVGWRCTECEAELQEDVDHRGSSFDLRVVESQEAGA